MVPILNRSPWGTLGICGECLRLLTFQSGHQGFLLTFGKFSPNASDYDVSVSLAVSWHGKISQASLRRRLSQYVHKMGIGYKWRWQHTSERSKHNECSVAQSSSRTVTKILRGWDLNPGKRRKPGITLVTADCKRGEEPRKKTRNTACLRIKPFLSY